MIRNIPFDENAICESCGKKGAFDFMGDELCGECAHAESSGVEDVSPAATPMRRFPIIDGPSIPWEVIESHDKQAQINHDQTLQRLAERGGLSPAEAWYVLNDQNWKPGTDWKKAHEDGRALLNSINLRYEFREFDVRELKAALRELVEKLKAIHEDERYKSVWVMYMIHGGKYEGPTYEEELAKAEQVLAGIGERSR